MSGSTSRNLIICPIKCNSQSNAELSLSVHVAGGRMECVDLFFLSTILNLKIRLKYTKLSLRISAFNISSFAVKNVVFLFFFLFHFAYSRVFLGSSKHLDMEDVIAILGFRAASGIPFLWKSFLHSLCPVLM